MWKTKHNGANDGANDEVPRMHKLLVSKPLKEEHPLPSEAEEDSMNMQEKRARDRSNSSEKPISPLKDRHLH